MSKRSRAADTIDARVAMINGQFDLPDGTSDRFDKIRAAIQHAAKVVSAEVRGAGDGNFDVGRLIAAVDMLQHAKDTACCALILPHAPSAT